MSPTGTGASVPVTIDRDGRHIGSSDGTSACHLGGTSRRGLEPHLAGRPAAAEPVGAGSVPDADGAASDWPWRPAPVRLELPSLVIRSPVSRQVLGDAANGIARR
jgi:hypothetical protein